MSVDPASREEVEAIQARADSGKRGSHEDWQAIRDRITLLRLLEDRENEIARHHRDFERWEEMAANGQERAERAEAQRDQAESRLYQATEILNALVAARFEGRGPIVRAARAFLASLASTEQEKG